MLFSSRNNSINDTEAFVRFRERMWNRFDYILKECYEEFTEKSLSGGEFYNVVYDLLYKVADGLGMNAAERTGEEIYNKLKDYILNANCNDIIFDVIESHINALYGRLKFPDKDVRLDSIVLRKRTVHIYKQFLKDENQPFQLYKNRVVPLMSDLELSELNAALKTPYDSVDRHIAKALRFFSDRKNPDYENSIKESISAVEAMCCTIAGMKGKVTLGQILDKLKDNGIEIHGAMRTGFEKLYGYTSNSDGIRHGGIDFTNAPEEDARFMLVSCAAFVNYLVAKKSKLKTTI